ncbi:hypothetical protein AMYX_39960 [Anaeromyxobacter diazotrophicus]|uniref:Uncharacterized protein n=2 Tax=Anaeromyxobacter diazotrophicus TaxID=2590199 RepID=A0A7I9VS70_9BACT|nr:hypothetical protein AMYX_39960 [Anaeromyxobacter diazotrophicus]
MIGVAARFRAEEVKLLDARQALAEAAVAATPALPSPAYSTRAMLSVIENIATAATVKPHKARELLRGVVDSILMTPTPDGYAVRVALKNISPAAWEGDGAEDYKTGCGGATVTFSEAFVARA